LSLWSEHWKSCGAISQRFLVSVKLNIGASGAEAAQVQQRAQEMAREEEKADFQTRLELYRAGKAYVQPAG
jgi:hypothetical protein